jgi:hypothetical protein
MAKWAVFSAHRYVVAGAAVPRVVGPDGRLLRRPWRQRSPEAVAAAREVRRARRQAVWPRVLGWACIGMAIWAALDPVGPMASHVAVSAATSPEPEVVRPEVVFPRGDLAAPPGEFTWVAEGACTLVLLDAGYHELARADGIEGGRYRPTGAFAEAIQTPGAYHWYALAGAGRQARKSVLETFVIR